MSPTSEVLTVDGLVKHFPVRRGLLGRVEGQVHAVDGVSFAIGPGETLGLVGESGCGKSTVGRTVLRLLQPTAGRIWLDGVDITHLGRAAMRDLRRRMRQALTPARRTRHGPSDRARNGFRFANRVKKPWKTMRPFVGVCRAKSLLLLDTGTPAGPTNHSSPLTPTTGG